MLTKYLKHSMELLWQKNINMHLKYMGRDNWIHLTQDRVQWLERVYMASLADNCELVKKTQLRGTGSQFKEYIGVSNSFNYRNVTYNKCAFHNTIFLLKYIISPK